jgi:uncharacterized membrane protein YfcA
MLADPAPTNALTISLLVAGAFFGAIASGGAGFAFAVVAASLWLHVFTPIRTTFLIVSCSVVLQSTLLWPMRRDIEFGRLWPFLAGGVLGIPIGVRLVVYTDPGTLKTALGVFLIAFGLYALLAPRLPRIGGGRLRDAVVGFIGGVMGGVGGYAGIAPTIWTQLRHWPKTVARAVYQPFILFSQMTTLILIGFVAFTTADAILLAIALPPLLAGAFVGWRIYGHLDEKRFKQLVAVLLIASGTTLVF